MAQNIAIERVDHIGVRVRNLDRALGFYRVLGFADDTFEAKVRFGRFIGMVSGEENTFFLRAFEAL
jgi:thiaminase/transcriptional activator TenA